MADVEVVVTGGPVTMVVSGATVSELTGTTVQSHVAGVGSVLPAGSVARAAKVCGTAERPVSVAGETQLAQSPVSTRHSKLELASLDENANVADVAVVVCEGPEAIDVSGSVVSSGGSSGGRVRAVRRPGRA